jgi:hypothetical protein
VRCQIVLSSSLTSSAKITIYPNSLILERERGLNIFEKKGRMKNLPIGVAGPVHHRGGGGGIFILPKEPWLGFRRGTGG